MTIEKQNKFQASGIAASSYIMTQLLTTETSAQVRYGKMIQDLSTLALYEQANKVN